MPLKRLAACVALMGTVLLSASCGDGQANAPITIAYMARGNFFIINFLLVLWEVPTGTDRELPHTFYGARAAREAADGLHRNTTVGSPG